MATMSIGKYVIEIEIDDRGKVIGTVMAQSSKGKCMNVLAESVMDKEEVEDAVIELWNKI
jgi:uncharacterized protein YuzE